MSSLKCSHNSVVKNFMSPQIYDYIEKTLKNLKDDLAS